MSYFGVLHMNDKVQQALSSGGATEYGDTYFYTQPRFETGDERYAWLNGIVAIGEGKIGQQRVDYRVYQVR
jgi:hypothetical protein